MILHVITRCTKTSNLLKIKQSIETSIEDGYDIFWHIVFDTSVLKDIDAELLETLNLEWIKLSFKSNGSKYSTLNNIIGNISEEGFIYILDDDNTLHRKDMDINEINNLKNDPDGYGKIWREFQTDKKFDLIVLKDVLEHLPDLNLVLQRLKSLLSETGIVYIQVPTFEGLEFLGYQNDFLRYFQNAHIVHFSEASLNYVFAKNGFDTVCSDVNGLAVFRHKVGSLNVLFDFEKQRNISLNRIVNILNRRRKVIAKERIWKLLPKRLIRVYHLIRKRGVQR